MTDLGPASSGPARHPVAAPKPRTLFLRPFTVHVFNRFVRPFVHRLPGFAIITYRGRTSGRLYRTPMKVFRDGDDYIFALTYGSFAHWVANVLAAGGAELQMGNRRVALTDPSVFFDPQRSLMPFPVRLFLRLLRVTEFLRMRAARP
jgi:deazaflavin-dependent oxidoreductase (nitroreductase family)